MTRTPARCTQADLARAIRAAKKNGGTGNVEFRPDGTIVVISSPLSTGDRANEQVEPEAEFVL